MRSGGRVNGSTGRRQRTRRSIMMLRKTSIALGTAITALVGLSVADHASARGYFDGSYYFVYRGGGAFQLYRASQPSQSLPETTSRLSNRDMRGAPSMGGRGMRDGSGMGGGGMNGGMGRR
jgi:hypothetical protein